MQLSRREFIGFTAGLTLTPVPSVLLRAAERLAAGPEEGVLVVLQLSGGNDGLNTVIPFRDPEYQRLRPSLAVRDGDLSLNDAGNASSGAADRPGAADLCYHPRMKALHELYRDGAVAIVQGVGYPNPSRSHFRSMDIWHTARPDREDVATGWLGGIVARHRGRLNALDVGDERLPLALQGEVQVPTLQNLDWVDQLSKPKGREMLQRLQRLNSGERVGEVEKVRALAQATLVDLEKVMELRGRPVPVDYPQSHLADKLKWIGQLIGGGFASRIYYLTHGGFDTHAQQKDAHALLVGQASEALAAFYRHLDALGAARRATVLVFSEFGRRVRENGSLGTDHGVAAPVFLVSKSLRGGLYGAHPSLTDLDEGDLKFHTDFRRIYATVLEDVLRIESAPILSGTYEKLPMFERRARV